MRDGAKLFTAVYVPKDDSQDLPDPADRARRTASRPTASTSTPTTSARRAVRARTATSSSTRTCAAGGCRRASSSTCGRTTPTKKPARRSTRAPTPTTPSTGWSKNVKATTARSAVGHLVPRLLHRRRHDRRPPRAQGRVAAGAGHRLVHRRRLAPQRRLFLPHCFNFMANFGQPRPGADARSSAVPAVRPRHARRLRLLPRDGAARRTPTRSTSRARSRSGTR